MRISKPAKKQQYLVFDNIAGRDAAKEDFVNGQEIKVTDASGDANIGAGWAIYKYDKETDVFDLLEKEEDALLGEIDHNLLKNYDIKNHLTPYGSLYQSGSSMFNYSNFAMAFMNHGIQLLTKLRINAWVKENTGSATSDYIMWQVVDENGTPANLPTPIDFIHSDGGTKKTVNMPAGVGWKLNNGEKYAILRVYVSEADKPDGTIYGYGSPQNNLKYRQGVFGLDPNSGEVDKTKYEIILAIAYLKDSHLTKPEDVVIWNFTDIQQPTDLNKDVDWYGVEWNTFANESPDLKRIGNMNYHKTLPIQSKMRRCMLWDNGTVHYYLDPNDSTKKEDGTAAVLDGSHGQVMVEVPEFYYTHEKDGYKHRYKISEKPLSGFRKIKKYYISAYEASMQRSTSKLSSVINLDVDYRGGNNNSAYDAGINSLLGKPVTNQTRAEFRTYAQNRGVNWHQQMPYEYYSMSMLAVIEYATFNLQQNINAVLTEQGYKQGGLGTGATTASSAEWSDFNGYNPALPCGQTNSLGNNTGEVDYLAIDFGGVGIDRTFKANSYRGVENPFGHIWKFMDGLNINEFVAYGTDNIASLSDDAIQGYEQIGLMPSANGYQKDVQDHLLPLPKTIGGASNTYLCDYYYQAAGWRVARVGGSLSNGSLAGLFCLPVNSSAAYRSAAVGARLCFRDE